MLASAAHFIDNAVALEMYPGPAAFTKTGVLFAWLVVPVLAWAAYRSASRTALVVYAAVGLLGFAHYMVAPAWTLAPRCHVTIWGEALTSAFMIAYLFSAPARDRI